MLKKELFEEITIHIDGEALAQLFELEPGFVAQTIEQDGGGFRLIFSRKTDFAGESARREERRRFL